MRTRHGRWWGLVLGMAMFNVAHADVTTVTEGVGISKVHIGEKADQAVHDLGPPSDSLYGFVFIYKLPGGTQLTVRMQENAVVSLNFSGKAGTGYQTVGGARFGMTHDEVVKLYGAPDAELADKIYYNKRGIGFFFNADGKLKEFWVFQPN